MICDQCKKNKECRKIHDKNGNLLFIGILSCKDFQPKGDENEIPKNV